MRSLARSASSVAALMLSMVSADAATVSKNITITVTASGGSSEEFVGPFPSWLNVSAGCSGAGAVGDGTTDDTAAIQRCLNALSNASTPVIYFPAPSVAYKITAALTVNGRQNIALVGQDPAATIIKWAGAAGGTMLSFTNNANSHVSRLTFDGQSSAASAVVDDWTGGNYFTQGNLYTDVVFKNTTDIAFNCGPSAGCADFPMIRAQFLNNNTGAYVANQNALDLNIWYSLFSGNVESIGNYVSGHGGGGGSYNVFNSVFINSSLVDNYVGNPLYFSFRHNYSSGSKYFVYGGGSCGSDGLSFQGNMILDPTTQAILLQDRGPALLVDNMIRSAGNPSVQTGACDIGSDMMSLGNTFTAGTVASDCSGSSPVGFLPTHPTGRCRSVLDTVASSATFNNSFNTAQPILPPTPPNLARTVYETSPSGSGTTCSASLPCSVQTAVCLAATGSSGFSAGACTGTPRPSRAVAHLLPANYTISATIVVPASDIQIIGDGFQSVLVGSGLSGAPVIKLAGPSQVVLRDFSLNGSAHTADGIEVDNADQAGAWVFGQLINIGDYTSSGIYSDALNRTVIEQHSLILNQNQATVTSGGVRVVGGGSNAGAQTNLFDFLATGNYLTFNVSGDGRVVAEDCWCGNEAEFLYNGVSGHKLATVTGSGAFTFSGALSETFGLSTDPAIAITNFTGASAVTQAFMSGEVAISGTGTGGNNLVEGIANQWKAEQSGAVVSGSPTLTFASGSVPAGVAAGQWVSDFCNPPAIPSSLTAPSTVLSKTLTTVVMSQNAIGNSNGCGGAGKDAIGFFSAVPASDSSGATFGRLNPMTWYNNATDQAPQQLPESGTATGGFLTTTLAQLRAATPSLPKPLVSGVTNVQMYNLDLIFLVNAIHVKA